VGSNPTSTAADLREHRSWQPTGGRVLLPWSHLVVSVTSRMRSIAGLSRSYRAWSRPSRTALNRSTHAAESCTWSSLNRRQAGATQHCRTADLVAVEVQNPPATAPTSSPSTATPRRPSRHPTHPRRLATGIRVHCSVKWRRRLPGLDQQVISACHKPHKILRLPLGARCLFSRKSGDFLGKRTRLTFGAASPNPGEAHPNLELLLASKASLLRT
jgi:hypothetical protein